MTTQDIIMVLVYTFPMLIFTIAPALKLGDYLQKQYNISEKQKRTVMILGTILLSLCLALFLQFY